MNLDKNTKTYSISDLCVGLLNVLVDIAWRFTVTWEAGNLACKFIKFMQALVTYASTYVLVALSIDRYDAITHPMNFSNCCTFYLHLNVVHYVLYKDFCMLNVVKYSL